MSDVDRAAQRAHETARQLASDAIDRPLKPNDATWLAGHLRTCAECRAVAEEYRAIHDELRALPQPEPPRDLWARTAAGLDQVDRARARRSGRRSSSGFRIGRLSWATSSLVSALAVALVVAVAGLSLLSQGQSAVTAPSASGTGQLAAVSGSPTGPQDAVAVVDGTSYWVTPQDGVYQIKGGSAACTGNASTCAVTNGKGEVLGSVASDTAVSVVISPSASQAAVWNADKVVILPLGSQPSTVSIDLLTPRLVTPSPTPEPTPTATATATATSEPTSGPATSPEPSPTPSDTASPAPTVAPATPAPSVAAAATQPIAILDGYRVVGRDPVFSADGQWVAFSARPTGAASGSDVFVWRVGWDRARAVTSSHVGLFSGWLGPRILISDFATNAAAPGVVAGRSYIYDPLTDAIRRIERPMLMPVVDPTGHYVVYWSGSVRFDPASGLWAAQQGDLYFDVWAAVLPAAAVPALDPAVAAASTDVPPAQPSDTPLEPGATPSPTESIGPTIAPSPSDIRPGLPQLLRVTARPGAVTNWAVRWDATGSYVAIWVGNGSSNTGEVRLFDVVPGQDLLDVDNPLLSAPSRSNIAFDGLQLVYTSPGQGGGNDKTYLFKLPAIPPAFTPTPEPTPTPTPEPTPTPQESAASVEPGSSASLSAGTGS